MNALGAIRVAEKLLKTAHIEEPAAKAKVIISHVIGDSLLADVNDDAWEKILGITKRVQDSEPIEYITGRAYFRYLELSVSPDVLIPRKETELVAGKAIELIRSCGYKKALDMCTGSGCIAISLATETDARVDASDVSIKAIKIAKQNAVDNSAEVGFFLSDMFENVGGTYDIIVCNPPYISDEEYKALNKSVKDFEPQLALKSGDGLEFYRIIAEQGPEHLTKGGALVLEIGAEQAEEVIKLLERAGLDDINCEKDYQGRDRIVTALKGR